MLRHSAFRPALLMKDGTTVYPTNTEWLTSFDALQEAVRVAELERCETYNGGCI